MSKLYLFCYMLDCCSCRCIMWSWSICLLCYICRWNWCLTIWTDLAADSLLLMLIFTASACVVAVDANKAPPLWTGRSLSGGDCWETSVGPCIVQVVVHKWFIFLSIYFDVFHLDVHRYSVVGNHCDVWFIVMIIGSPFYGKARNLTYNRFCVIVQ